MPAFAQSNSTSSSFPNSNSHYLSRPQALQILRPRELSLLSQRLAMRNTAGLGSTTQGATLRPSAALILQLQSAKAETRKVVSFFLEALCEGAEIVVP